jgi:hypothetical protein
MIQFRLPHLLPHRGALLVDEFQVVVQVLVRAGDQIREFQRAALRVLAGSVK